MKFKTFIIVTILFGFTFLFVEPKAANARRSFVRSATKSISKAIRKNTRQALRPSFEIKSRYASSVNALSVDSNENQFVTAGANGAIYVWDMKTGQQKKVLRHDGTSIFSVSFVPGKNQLIASYSNGQIVLWDIIEATIIREFIAVNKLVSHIAITPHSSKKNKTRGFAKTTTRHEYSHQLLITANQDTVLIWNLETANLVRKFTAHSKDISCLTISKSGFLAASGDNSGEILVWNWQTGEVQKEFTINNDAVSALSFNSRVTTLSSGTHKGSIYTWDLSSDLISTKISAHSGKINGITFSSGQDQIATVGEDKLIKIWSVSDAELVNEIKGHQDEINTVTYTGEGEFIFTTSNDRTSRLWHQKSGIEAVRLVSMHNGWAAVSPKGYFDGTLDGDLEDRLDAISWTVETRSFNVDGFLEGYYRPALLGEIFAGNDVALLSNLPSISEGFPLPPLVRITSPAPDIRLSSREIKVNIEVSEQGGGVGEVRLYHNSKIVNKRNADIENGKGDHKDNIIVTYSVTLADNANTFKAVALSTTMIESEASETEVFYVGDDKIAPPQLHLFVIGINKYKNEELNLNYGVPDAQAVIHLFSDSASNTFAGTITNKLFDTHATQENVYKLLKKMETIPQQDTIIIYFAGHGENIGDEWYFIPYELAELAKPKYVALQGVSYKNLQSQIVKSEARRILLILDACKSGAAVDDFSSYKVQRPFAILSRSTGIHIAAASAKGQYASELKSLGHGVFTYALLQGGNGMADQKPTDGLISVVEILDYVKTKLPLLIKKLNISNQKPVTFSRGLDFTISRVKDKETL